MGHVQKHDIDSTDHHSPSTLAELSTMVSDATLARRPKFSYFSANHTITDAFDVLIGITNEFTFTLPPAISYISGTTSIFFTIKNSFNNTNNITIDGGGAELIEGAASMIVAPGAAVTVVSDGTTWHVI